ncbi:MAG: SBBP repeat-containing protein [Thermomicrobiales bacterium]
MLRRWIRTMFVAFALLATMVGSLPAATAYPAVRATHDTKARAALQAYGDLSLSFEVNQGQADQRVAFLTHAIGSTVLLTPDEMIVTASPMSATLPDAPARVANTPGMALHLRYLGANPSPQITGATPLPGIVNYYTGNDRSQWREGVPTYGEVRYRDLYPGVDLRYYGTQRALEYDLIVAPGADPRTITFEVAGGNTLTLAENGDLVIATPDGQARQHHPVLYQEESDGARQRVAGGYALAGAGRVRFDIGAYDTGKPLVIDPVLTYATVLDGGLPGGASIAVDNAGNVYITGNMATNGTPATNVYPVIVCGGSANADCGAKDYAFVTAFSVDGSRMLYTTILGGTTNDCAYASGFCIPGIIGHNVGNGIGVAPNGSASITGSTWSDNFPTTSGAFQEHLPDQFCPNNGDPNCLPYHAFVAQLASGTGTLTYATYLAGNIADYGNAITYLAFGAVAVAGSTSSTLFPVQMPVQAALPNANSSNAFVAVLQPFASDPTQQLLFSTYLGGSNGGVIGDAATGIRLGPGGSLYVTGNAKSSDFPTRNPLQGALGGGTDAFVARIDGVLNGSPTLAFSTYLGGSGDDFATGIAVDSQGNAYITGDTNSANFPTKAGPQPTKNGGMDAFVAKLQPNGAGLVYSTFLGGGGDDEGYGIAVDSQGVAYVTGGTGSADFPLKNSLQPAATGSVFVTAIQADGAGFVYSTLLGSGTGEGVVADSQGNAYVVGFAGSGFPTTANAAQRTLNNAHGGFFVAKLGPQARGIPPVNIVFTTPTPSGTGMAIPPPSPAPTVPPANIVFTPPPTATQEPIG